MKKITRTVNVKGELIVKGGKCTTEKIRPRPRTVTGLGYFWNKGLLQVNFMIKQPSRREFSIPRLIEDLGILSILWRELLFYLFCCLCQGHRESEFLDMGMVFPKHSSEGGCISLLGINLSSVLGFISFNHSEIS